MLFIDSVFYSYAQILFSNKRWFGALMFISTLINPVMGLMGLSGVIISNLIALYLKFDKEKIRSGYYGFNGILFGLSAYYFFNLSPFFLLIVFIFILVTFFMSATLEHLMANVFNLPGLSLPFILTLYIFLVFSSNYSDIFFKGLNLSTQMGNIIVPKFAVGYFKAMGLILFQTNILSGIIITAAVLLFSRVMFVNTVFAYAANYFLLKLLFPQFTEELFLLTSFNAVLVAVALGGSLIIISRKSLPLIFVSVLFVIVFSGFFEKLLTAYFLPVLVLPFNFIVLSVIYSLKFRGEQSDLVLLYFKPGSPEENYYYHQNRISRFEKFKYFFTELPFWGEWKISQGFNGKFTHKDEWKHAWDFVIPNENGNEYSDTGESTNDYSCFSTPVVAPLDGTVVRVVNNIPDNKIGDVNLKNNWGNTIIIDHGEGLFSKLSHLKKKSIKVELGDEIKKGEIVAQCGNSGRSPTPHLHFQFQLTDKIDSGTYKFPISLFLEKQYGDKFELKTYDYPAENSMVKNLESHKLLKDAFNFDLGRKLKFNCKINNEQFSESWEVKVDIFNNPYIQSDNKAKAYFYLQDKLFWMTDFQGNQKSALYFFYLLAVKIPLGYSTELEWRDKLPVSKTMKGFLRYFSEFFLLFTQPFETIVESTFFKKDEQDTNFEIHAKIVSEGKNIFKFYKVTNNGKILINENGEIESFHFSSEKINFESNKKEIK